MVLTLYKLVDSSHQTHCFAELEVLWIGPGTLGSEARKSDHYNTEVVTEISFTLHCHLDSDIGRIVDSNPKGDSDANGCFDETEYENRSNNLLGLEDSDEEIRERDQDRVEPVVKEERKDKARRGHAQPTAHGNKGKGERANHAARGPEDKRRGIRHRVPPPLKLKGWTGGD
uniref:(California timema) hypothetical protein n=1 Tax=Timema californicum TaxID=61474 RepID=A0A7R9J3K0_TIMCA|nr:unnamed protein product [Timema californicum]